MKDLSIKDECKFRINLQLFAEEGSPEGGENPEEQTQETGADEVFTKEQVDTMKKEWEKDLANKLKTAKKEGLSEAERLAGMSEAERQAEKLKQLEEENNALKAESSFKALKEEAGKLLAHEKLSPAFVDMVIGKDAESTKANIAKFKEVYNAELQAAVEERLKGDTPSSSTAQVTTGSEFGFNFTGVRQKPVNK